MIIKKTEDKKFFFLIFGSIFTVIFFSIYLITPKECFDKKLFNSIKELGYGSIKTCYTNENIKKGIKQKLIKIPFAYKIAAKIKITFFKDFATQDNINFDLYDKSKGVYDNSYIPKNILALTENELSQIIKNYKNKADKNKKFESWTRSHANNWNNKFIDTNLINTTNIKNLDLLWKYNSNNSKDKSLWKENAEANPVFDDGILYFLSSDRSLNAINVVTGNMIWKKNFIATPSRRGFLINEEKGKKYIYITSNRRLFKINAKDGNLEKSFGDSGSVFAGLILVAPVIYNNNIVLLEVIKRNILTYNINDGDLTSKTPMHPQNEIKELSIPWGGAALDSETGYLFYTTGNPKPSLYGVNRPGKNLNSNSVIAFDLNNLKIVWSFQETSHDLWDFDLGSPPIIADIDFKNHSLKVVIITSKTGNTFIFERNSGKTLFDINYKKAPASKISGEFTSNYQIFNTLPERFSRTEFDLSNLRSIFFEDKNFIKKFKEESIWGWFEPPSLDKDLILFGIHGGNSWYGASFNQKNNVIYIPSQNVPYKIKMNYQSEEGQNDINFPENLKKAHKLYINNCSSCHGATRNGNIKMNVQKIVNYVPSLVGMTTHKNLKSKINDYDNFTKKHTSLETNINKNDYNELIKLFKFWDNSILKSNKMKMDGFWAKNIGKDNMLITKPPWGEIIALNIESGKILWKSPFGYKKINGQEKKIGTLSNGGLSSTSSGVIFANGTADSYAIALDASNGQELWKYKMDAPGTTPPILFTHNNKFYVSFVSTGVQFYNSNKKDFSIYTFGLK